MNWLNDVTSKHTVPAAQDGNETHALVAYPEGRPENEVVRCLCGREVLYGRMLARKQKLEAITCPRCQDILAFKEDRLLRQIPSIN